MKKENGVTLLSLVIYVVVMAIIMATMSIITTDFYKNTAILKGNVQDVVEFCKFNNYFLKEVKITENKVISISGNYILFASGNSFSISNNGIYFNNIKICNNVQGLEFEKLRDNEDTDEQYSIIKATVNFNSYSKSINYKLENIY